MRLKPGSHVDVENVQEAIGHLKKARDLLKGSHCPKTTRRVRLALTSAQGAERHAYRRSMPHTLDYYIEYLVTVARTGKPWRGKKTAAKDDFVKFVLPQVEVSEKKVRESIERLERASRLPFALT